jgi:hypothetical protein
MAYKTTQYKEHFFPQEKGVFCTSVEPRARKLTKAQRRVLAEKGVPLPKDSTAPDNLPENLVGAQRRQLFADNNYWTEIVRKEATLLVGLHPDQVRTGYLKFRLY